MLTDLDLEAMLGTKSFRVYRLSEAEEAESTRQADRYEICIDENNIIKNISIFRVL